MTDFKNWNLGKSRSDENIGLTNEEDLEHGDMSRPFVYKDDFNLCIFTLARIIITYNTNIKYGKTEALIV